MADGDCVTAGFPCIRTSWWNLIENIDQHSAEPRKFEVSYILLGSFDVIFVSFCCHIINFNKNIIHIQFSSVKYDIYKHRNYARGLLKSNRIF